MEAEGIWEVNKKLDASKEAQVKERMFDMVSAESDLGIHRSKCFIMG